MKKLFLVLAVVASLQAFDAQAQVKTPAAAKSAVEKAEATTENPKQSAKPATWVKYGDALLDAYDAPIGNVWIGMSRQELDMLGGGERPSSEEVVDLSGRQMTKLVYATKNLYLNENGQLEVIEVTVPVVENVLDKALEAFTKAAEVDAKGQKTKDITAGLSSVAKKYSDEAYNAFTLGNATLSSELFEKADVTTDDVAEALELIRSTDSVDRCLSKAREYVDEAVGYMDSVPDSIYKDALLDLASYIVRRDR